MTIMTGRRWAIVLFCSLALNLFLGGLLVADKYFGHQRGHSLARMLYSPPWAARVVGKDIRPQMRELFRNRRASIRANRRALRETHGQLNAQLAAEPFQKDQFAASLGRLRVLTQGAQAAMHEDMATLAAGLSQAQRQELAVAVDQWVERRARRAERRRQRHAGDRE
jgi:uncharacterized membrane protein